MSAELLQRVESHIITDGGLLGGYTIRHYKWNDRDLKGAGSVCLFRMTGTSGEVTSQAQMHDVSLFLLTDPDRASQADADMLEVLRYLRANFSGRDVFNYYPPQSYNGPISLSNGRAMFEMIIRCGVEDH